MRSTGEVTQVAVVTGASRGIGRLFALSLARSGTTVIAISRSSEDLRSLEVDADGIRLRTYAADVTDPAQVDLALQRAVSDAGPPQLLVTCAGTVDGLGPIARASTRIDGGTRSASTFEGPCCAPSPP